MDIFGRLKQLTDWVPGKEIIRPLYMPVIRAYRYRRDNRRFRASGTATLLAAKEALDGINVSFWPDFGTLLGITRDGELIRHDTDVDIAVMIEDKNPAIRTALEQMGFSLLYVIEAKGEHQYAYEESYVREGVGLDIFYYHREGDRMWCHLFPNNAKGQRVVREVSMIYSGLSPFSFAGQEWTIPTNYSQRLIDTYGEEYLIPDPNWYTPNDALNSKLIDLKVDEYRYDK